MSDSITIEDYNPLWPHLFEEEARRLKSIVGGVQIEHHGSTAVPGLPAKPVIDMMVAIATMDEGEEYASRLRSEGYEDVDRRYRKSMPERIVMIGRSSDGARKCHVHLMLRDNPMWARQIAFRDYMRDHPECALEYAELKYTLAQELSEDRHGYMIAKTEFIERMTDLAIAEQRDAAGA